MDVAVDKEKVLPNEGAGAVGAAAAKAEATVKSAAKRGRGRPTKAQKEAEERERAKAFQAQLDEMFSPKNWRYIVRAPADTALAVTGDPIWQLEDDEVEALAAQASGCGRQFIQTDPKWLALAMLSMTIMTTYGTRAAVYFRNKKEAQKRDAQPAYTKSYEQ